MRTSASSVRRIAITLSGMLALNGVAVGQVPGSEVTRRAITMQSELDYLRAAKTRFTIHLKQVTIKQAYEGIARTTGVDIAFEGVLNEETKHDVQFTAVTLKQILSKLGQRFDLSYRVDGPEKLTVFGAQSK